jgi:bacillithiol system protein YtxJ
MSFFSSIFNGNEIDWSENILDSADQFKELIEKSYSKPQLIFKHSTRCSVSIYILKDFISNNVEYKSNIDWWYLDILKYRSISNLIADDFKLIHQSPQLIIIIDGVVSKHASHEKIKNIKLSDY